MFRTPGIRKVKYTKKKKNKKKIDNLWNKFDDEKLSEKKKIRITLYSK